MKLSFCSIAFRKTGESLTEIIPMLAQVGYEGVEIWANHLAGDGTDVDTIASCLAEYDLCVPMISPYFNVTGDEGQWQTTVASARKYYDYAKALGAPLLRAFTGFLGSDEVDDDLWGLAVQRLTRLCDTAADRGLGIALETHPKTLVDKVPAIHRLLEDVSRPNLGLNLDIYHLWEQHKDPSWVWSQLRPFVRHIHAKNAVIPPSDGDDYPLFHDKQGLQEIDGVTYLGHGNMCYAPFLARLAREGFSDWISVEWFGGDPLTAADHELTWLRSHIPAAENEIHFRLEKSSQANP